MSIRKSALRNKRQTRRLFLESLEHRRVLAASLGWDGPGLGSAELTYHIANSPSSLTQAETNAAIETALSAWASAADITFTPTDRAGLADSIDISFTNIDGSAGILAQAYFPDDVKSARLAGDIQFDSSESWEVGNALGNQAFDLVWVAAHEIGHSLGLDHLGSIGSVLAPFVSPSQVFTTLSSVDVSVVQGLYAAAGVDQTATTDPTDTTDVDPTDTTDPTDSTGPTDPGDTDDIPFPRHRWRRGGNWHRFGGRLEGDLPQFQNYINPMDVNGDNTISPLDALTIINQLSDSSDGATVTGMCDANGDGEISALDALTIINAINEGNPVAPISINIVTIDDTGDTTDLTDSTDPVDETPVDDVDDSETPVDDGGIIDDEDAVVEDTDDEVDDPVCNHDSHEHGSHHRGDPHHRMHFGLDVGLFGANAEVFLAKFDANEDGSLSEDEVTEKIWAKLTEQGVDTDGDGLVTLDELHAAITAAREEKFAELDADADGLLTESEVGTRLWSKLSDADADADLGVSLSEIETWLAERVTTDTEMTDSETQVAEWVGGGHRRHHGVDEVFAEIGRGFASARQWR